MSRAPKTSADVYAGDAGRTFDDFVIGETIQHRPGRTISEVDNTWFTLLTMNTHPLHFDADYAACSEFGRPLVNSCLTLAMVTGMSVSDVSQRAIANLGWSNIKLTAPVFVGDTIYAETEVLAKRLSQSRKGRASSPSARAASRRMERCSWSSSAACCCPSRSERKGSTLMRSDRQA